MQCDQWLHEELKIFLHYLWLLERTFGWALYPSSFLFLFVLHLDWSLNTSDKKINKIIKCSFYICEFVFHFSLRFKFFSGWFYFLLKYTLQSEKANRDKTGFYLLTSPLKWKFLYIPPFPFYYHPLPARPPPF